jgi:hypothetical protein
VRLQVRAVLEGRAEAVSLLEEPMSVDGDEPAFACAIVPHPRSKAGFRVWVAQVTTMQVSATLLAALGGNVTEASAARCRSQPSHRRVYFASREEIMARQTWDGEPIGTQASLLLQRPVRMRTALSTILVNYSRSTLAARVGGSTPEGRGPLYGQFPPEPVEQQAPAVEGEIEGSSDEQERSAEMEEEEEEDLGAKVSNGVDGPEPEDSDRGILQGQDDYSDDSAQDILGRIAGDGAGSGDDDRQRSSADESSESADDDELVSKRPPKDPAAAAAAAAEMVLERSDFGSSSPPTDQVLLSVALPSRHRRSRRRPRGTTAAGQNDDGGDHTRAVRATGRARQRRGGGSTVAVSQSAPLLLPRRRRQRRQLPAAAVRVSPGRQRRPRSEGGYEAPLAEHRSSSPTAVHVVASAPVLPGPSGDIASAQGLMPKLQAMVEQDRALHLRLSSELNRQRATAADKAATVERLSAELQLRHTVGQAQAVRGLFHPTRLSLRSPFRNDGNGLLELTYTTGILL